MHELALSQSIVSLVSEQARQHGFRSVTRVVVEVGAAAGVEPEALRFCFDVAAERTCVKGAELVTVPIALRARCRACNTEYMPGSLIAPCTNCGSYERDILAGRELRVTRFEAA
jgi:hydrogenase nickel incorporation protein HypA/HybF